MYTPHKHIITAGIPVADAKKAMIFLHGRGATANDIIALNDHLKINDAALFAPQATNNSWYPYSFLTPVEQNQPELNVALEVIGELVIEIVTSGIPHHQIYFIGFSQGACLTLEYVSRNAMQYGGIVALTGGLIGKEINMNNYKGDFNQTPILITTGDPDPHVPVRRVEISEQIIRQMNGNVTLKVYAGKPHSISLKEIELARKILVSDTDL